MKISVYSTQNHSVSLKEAPSVFSLDMINQHLIWEIITAENANLRQGTHKTKTRGEVRGGGRKPWRQKGTGHARAGSNRSPIWVGGGVTFGPQPRDYRQKINKNKKKVGYRNIIAQKIKNEKLMVLDDLKLDKISTNQAFQRIDKILKKAPFYSEYKKDRKLRSKTNDKRRTLTIVVAEDDQNIKKSFKNIPWLNLIHSDRLAARPVFYNHGLLFTEKAFEKITKSLAN